MGVDTRELRGISGDVWEKLNAHKGCLVQDAADELDALRADNAKLREERQELARALLQAYSSFGYCKLCHAHGLHPHDPSCPVALAERMLAEKATQYCPTTEDNAPDAAQDGAHG